MLKRLEFAVAAAMILYCVFILTYLYVEFFYVLLKKVWGG